MSVEQPRGGTDLQWFVRSVCPAPPEMPTGTPPQCPAGTPTIVLPFDEDKATGLHRLGALGTGRDVVGHAGHPNEATASSRSNLGGVAAAGRPGSYLVQRSTGVHCCPPLFVCVVTQLDTDSGRRPPGRARHGGLLLASDSCAITGGIPVGLLLLRLLLSRRQSRGSLAVARRTIWGHL